MQTLTGFYDDYTLNGITYSDKVGDDYGDQDLPSHVTYNDMNEIKRTINENNVALARFGKDIVDKVEGLVLSSNMITEEEEIYIMNRLGLV